MSSPRLASGVAAVRQAREPYEDAAPRLDGGRRQEATADAEAGRRGREEHFRPFHKKTRRFGFARRGGRGPLPGRRGGAAKSETVKAQACPMGGARDRRWGLRGKKMFEIGLRSESMCLLNSRNTQLESQSLTFTRFESEQMMRKAHRFSFTLDLRP